MKCLWLFLACFSIAATAQTSPRVVQASLVKSTVSAGEFLTVQYTMADNRPMLTNSGSAFWLGYIVQNVFWGNWSGVNLNSEPLGGNQWSIAGQVNPWVVPRQPTYSLEQICMTDATLTQICINAGADGYYYDGAAKTSIQILSFTVLPNPNGDGVRPVITNVTADKSTYRPGEAITFTLTVTDDHSGVGNYAQVGSIYSGQVASVAGLGPLQAIGNNQYLLTGYNVGSTVPPGPLPVTEVSTTDVAGNIVNLQQVNATDQFYTDTTAQQMTNIPVVIVQVTN